MRNSDRVSGLQPTRSDIEAHFDLIVTLVPELIATDRGELARARDEIDGAHKCPSGAKEAEYARLAQGMIDELEELLAQFKSRYRDRWVKALSAPQSMAAGVLQWDVAVDDARAATERLTRMYAERDKWQGTAAASYWSQLPGQGSATAQLATSSDAQGAALATGSLSHQLLNAKVMQAFERTFFELWNAQSKEGGNGLYMRRTAQATASLRSLVAWLGEAEDSGAAEAEYLNSRLHTQESKLDDWDELANGSSQSGSVGNRTDTTMGSTRVDAYEGQVTDEGLHISVVG